MNGMALVTGAAGFVGRHIVRVLAEQGVRVRGLDLAYVPALEEAECHVGSILDPDVLAAAVDGVDTVFHCAAIPHLWTPDPQDFDRVNVLGTERVVAAARAAGATGLVHVSSFVTLMAARLRGQTVDESVQTTEADMLGAYPLSKYRSEQVALASATPDFKVVAVLPPAPIGPLDHGLTPPTRLVRDLLDRRIPAVLDTIMNVVDVRSLALGIVHAAEHGQSGERYLLTGENLSMRDFLVTLEAVSGTSMPRRMVPVPVAWSAAWVDEHLIARLTGRAPGAPLTGVRLAATKMRFDNSKARTALGFAPPPIDAAIGDAVEWLRASGLCRRDQETG